MREHFSDIYRRAARDYSSLWPDRHMIDEILHNATKQNISVIVVTDGERILGTGDQELAAWGFPSANFRCTPPAVVLRRIRCQSYWMRNEQFPIAQ